MKKPILGIIAVFCLQLGFIAYTAFDLPVDFASVPPVARATAKSVQLETGLDPIVVVRSGGPVAIERVRHDPGSTRVSPTARRARKPQPDQNITATRQPPRERPRTEYPGGVPEKRSFAAKVMPVIKKPYDWAKAIAGIFK